MSAAGTITVVSTGGTIAKRYDESAGTIGNTGDAEAAAFVIEAMLAGVRTEGAEVSVVPLLDKDSLEMTEADRDAVAAAVRAHADAGPVVVTHGTDTLAATGDRLVAEFSGVPPHAVVLTGAMRPFAVRESDAAQNLTEALFAARVLGAGVWCVAHGRALAFPGVRKDPGLLTFVKDGAGPGVSA